MFYEKNTKRCKQIKLSSGLIQEMYYVYVPLDRLHHVQREEGKADATGKVWVQAVLSHVFCSAGLVFGVEAKLVLLIETDKTRHC